MISVFKNNFFRLLSRKQYFVIFFMMIIGSIFMGIYFSSTVKIKPTVAILKESLQFKEPLNAFHLKVVEAIPKKSELILGKYDAVIIPLENDLYEIQTIKNDDFKAVIAAALYNESPPKALNENSRGLGTTILGYLTMFLLLQSVSFMFVFGEDKDQKQITRIAASPLPFSKYLAGHALFNFLMIYLPTFLTLIITKTLFKLDIGFSLLYYLLFLVLLCSFGTAYSLLANTFADTADNANMLGSSVILLTTILSGSFYSFSENNSLFDALLHILPQKNYLILVESLEKGKSLLSVLPQLFYFIVIICSLFLISVIKNKKDYVQHND